MLINSVTEPRLVGISYPSKLSQKGRSSQNFELHAKGEDGFYRAVAELEVRDAAHRVPARTRWCRRIGKRIDFADRDDGRIVNLAGFDVLDPRLKECASSLITLAITLLPRILSPSNPRFLWMFDWVHGKECLSADLLDHSWIKLNEAGMPAKAGESAAYAYMPLVEEVEEEFIERETRGKKVRGEKRLDRDFSRGLPPESLEELVSLLARHPDPRPQERVRYSSATLLAVVVLARKAGSVSFRTHAAWVSLLSEEQLRALGLKKRSEDSGPSDDTIRRFVAAIGKPRKIAAMTGSVPDERSALPMIGENVVRGDFNTWLQEHLGEDAVFRDQLWKQKDGNSQKTLRKPRRAPWYHISEKYSHLERPSPQRNPVIMDSVVWTLSDHLEKAFSGKDPRPSYQDKCPLRPVLFLLGLGRCYVGSTGEAIWLWAHRFDQLLLDSMGLDKSIDGKLVIPGPTYLTGVIKDFKRENFEKLDRAVSEWFRKENKVAILEADGGKLRKVRKGSGGNRTGNAGKFRLVT